MERLANPKRPITLILLATAGALCFTVGGGVFLHRNHQNLIAAREWIEHTQDVLLSVQRTSQEADRIEAATDYSVATNDAKSLSQAQDDAIQFQTEVLHLEHLVADNRVQDAGIRELASCSNTVAQTLNAAGDLSAVKSALLRCRRTLSLMAEQENQQLLERTASSNRSSQISLISEISFVSVSILALAVLFFLIARDAMWRANIARQWMQTNRELERSNLELAETMATLERYAQQALMLAAVRDELPLCSTAEEIYRAAALQAPQMFPGTRGTFAVINNSRDMMETISSWGFLGPSVAEIYAPDSCCGLRSGQPRWRKPGVSETHCTHFAGQAPERYACIPLTAQGETLGVLYICFRTQEIMDDVAEQSDSLLQLVHLAAMAHASLMMRLKLENQSIRDPLTGLFNRHFMQISFDRELSRAVRRKHQLAVFMIDVDHFKQFNDRFSHAAGDAVLREVAHVLQQTVRAEDFVCRYGGEEFAVILPEITEEAALARAEHLRSTIAELSLKMGSDLSAKVSISIGVALFPRHGSTADDLLQWADSALYRAKHEGRNRVCLSEESALKTA